MRNNWKKQEINIAKKFSGKRQPGSGNRQTFTLKGDVKSETFLHEAKDTSANQYRLALSDLKKLEGQALALNRIPLFQVSIKNEDYVVLKLSDFIGLLSSPLPAQSLVPELNKPRRTARQRAKDKNVI